MTDDFDKLMDAHQTLLQLKPGDVLTQEMIDDLLLVERDYRENDERCTDAFHKGYQVGLERGGGADTAKLIQERDDARTEAIAAKAVARLGEELNVPPKRRITIPEGQIAVLLPKQIAEDVKGLCFRVRRGRRLATDEKQAMQEIAGDLLLAVVEAIDEQFLL